MRRIEVVETLQNSLIAMNVIRIKRNKIDNEPIHCIPLLIGKETLLVQYLYDYQFDGYQIIRLKDITSVRDSDIEKFVKYILLEEGILNQVGISSLVNLDSWKKTFHDLKDLGKNLIVECENPKNWGFHIGKIIGIDKNTLLFLNFDSLGKWDENPTTIYFKDITSVTLESRYVSTISKYLSLNAHFD